MHAVILPPGRQESKRAGSGSSQPSGVHSQLWLCLWAAQRRERREHFPLLQPRHRVSRGGRPGGSRELEPRGAAADLFAVSGLAPPPAGGPAPQTLTPPAGVRGWGRSVQTLAPPTSPSKSPTCSVPAGETQLNFPVSLSVHRGVPELPLPDSIQDFCPPSSFPLSAGSTAPLTTGSHTQVHTRSHLHLRACTHMHTRSHLPPRAQSPPSFASAGPTGGTPSAAAQRSGWG